MTINNQAQGEILVPIFDAGNRKKEISLFWITDSFYNNLLPELMELEELTYGVHGFIKKSEMIHPYTLELLERIIHSNFFRMEDAKIIGE